MLETALKFPVWVLAESTYKPGLPETGVRMWTYAGIGSVLPIFTEERLAQRMASQGPGFATAKPRSHSAAELKIIVKGVIDAGRTTLAGIDPDQHRADELCWLDKLLADLDSEDSTY